ncbi:ribosomal RNA small subunit methyltransferase I [Clostridia bacterium]|nr:ribosomal RNA small subunit methyltransferase I [Clostridia bacterium]
MDILPNTLYVVGTPIGNLGDFSPRAAEVLRGVSFIAAEDTRVTRKLLSHLDIHTPLVSYHEHNMLESGEKIIEKLLDGQSAALVTDAGMPAISDPGQELVKLCRERGAEVAAVPGPSAVTAALALSGVRAGRFCFEGFLSVNKRSRREHLAQLKDEPRVMVFYEAPHKLTAALKDFLEAFGDRKIVLAREMTKLHEEVVSATLAEAIKRYTENAPRGEFVLVIEGAPPKTEQAADGLALARGLIAEGVSLSRAARSAAADSGMNRAEIYRLLLEENRENT